MNLEQIRHALADRSLKKVADATGLHVNTIKEIRDNKAANPTYRVLTALAQYIEETAVKHG